MLWNLIAVIEDLIRQMTIKIYFSDIKYFKSDIYKTNQAVLSSL